MLVIRSARQVLANVKKVDSTNKWLFFSYNIFIYNLLEKEMKYNEHLNWLAPRFFFFNKKCRFNFDISDRQRINLELIYI